VADPHPLLYSGIALAGANRRAEQRDGADDGILTADEFAALDLSRAQVMVITGCNTGRGDYVAGQGVFGLRRALERAGVRSVVLGLWPIRDEIAQRWSREFYKACWGSGTSPSAAAKHAAQQLRAELHKAGAPDRAGSWGAFVASGCD
jgi:CHAT domain-containing protein